MVLTNSVVAVFVVCVYGLGVFVARATGRKASFSLAPLGFTRPRSGLLSGVGLGFAVGLAAIVVSIIVNPISVFVFDRLGFSTESTVQQPFMRGLVGWVETNPAAAIPAIVSVVVLFGPAVEELVFRGAVFNGLDRLGTALFLKSDGPSPTRSRTSFVFAALVSSTLFALLHLEPVLLPAILLLAVALCALFRQTGSLLPSFVAHATFNSFATTLIILNGLGVLSMPV